MTRRQHHNSISLFPFLAVLVCAMGALILLLLVMTRKIRHEQHSAFDQAEMTSTLEIPTAAPDRSAELSEIQSQILEAERWQSDKRSQRDALQTAVNERRQQLHGLQNELEALQKQIVNAAREANPADLNSIIDETSRLKAKEAALLRQLDLSEQTLLEKQEQLTAATDASKKAEMVLHEKNSALVTLRAQVQDAQKVLQSASGTATLLEFTNSTGTTRTPIVIDVTEEGFEILPNSIRITKQDMENFPVRDNPLLSAVLAAHRHRTKVALSDEPYVLLLVRPQGCLSFYGAQRVLAESHIHYGYELLDSDREVVAGDADPTEVPVVQAAMEDAFRRRDNVYAKLMEIAQQRTGVTGTDTDPAPSARKRQFSIRPDGRVVAEDPGERRPLDGRFYAGGVAPPAEHFRNRPAGGYQGLDRNRLTAADAEKLAEEFAARYAQQQAVARGGSAADAEGGSSEPGSQYPQSGDIARLPVEEKSAEALFGGHERLQAELTPYGDQSGRMLQQSSESSGFSDSDAFPSLVSGEFGEVSTGRPDLSRIDPDLLKRLQSAKRTSGSLATPVGITVFLDEHHMTVGQQTAIEVTPDTLQTALSTLLTGVSTEVDDFRRDPKEPLMPIVKFVVSPGGEKWRIPLAESLKDTGLHSVAVYELTPYMISSDSTGYARVEDGTY